MPTAIGEELIMAEKAGNQTPNTPDVSETELREMKS
jgi:hypothetical protein